MAVQVCTEFIHWCVRQYVRSVRVPDLLKQNQVMYVESKKTH